MIHAALVNRPASPAATVFCPPLAPAQRNIRLPECRPAPVTYRWTVAESGKAWATAEEFPDSRCEQPKSLLRYIAPALFLVAPVLLAFTGYVETRVAPVASYVAQVYGSQGSTQTADK